MKKFIALALAALMVVSLAACGKKAESAPAATEAAAAAESDLAYIKGKGTLIVGITDFAPMDYKNDAGEWIGFDADMAKAFAESIGVKAEFVEIDWDNKILELNNKSIDVVWNGMTLTNEVMNSMSCGDPYCNNAQVVVVKSDIADKMKDKDSVKDLAFAVEAGSAGEAAVKELGIEPTAVQTQADALMNVAAGTADAAVIDLLMAAAMVGEGTSYPDLAYTVELTSEEYGCGFRKDGDVAAAYNEFYKKAYNDGTVMKIATEYGVQASIIPAK